VARLTDSQADALVAALTRESGVFAVSGDLSPDIGAWHPAEGVEPPVQPRGESDEWVERLRSLVHDNTRLDELGRALTLDLASYLRRPVRCSLGHAVPAIPTAWRFGAKTRGGFVWLDIDIALAAALGDAMIGGDGTGAIGRGRRVRALASVAARRMLETIASAATIALTDATETLAPDPAFGAPIAGGSCAVAVAQYPWTMGAAFDAPIATRSSPSAASPASPARATAPERSFQPAPSSRRAAPSPIESGVQPASDPEAALSAAIDALDARLSELTLRTVAARPAKVERIAGSEVAGPSSAALGLALSAGGNGVVVAFADAAAVSGLAAGAAGGRPAEAGQPGEVVIAAAEAVLRDALERAALRLPALGDEGHRVVRLSDDPLTARTPHHAVDISLAIGDRTAWLRVLVPSWMLANRTKRAR
jgi:hypothetical protein